MPEKIDFKKTLDSYKAKSGEFRVLEMPSLQYLMIDGSGDPNTSPEYVAALEALYPIAYKLKFASKRDLGRDYVVPPLEGLWWADDMASFTSTRDKSQWHWTMMILAPEWIDRAMFEATIAAIAKTNAAPSRLGDVRLQTLAEGRCVQTLHHGSYDDEAPTLARMHDEFIPSQGLSMTGLHHEVYFTDARKTPTEKMRTLLRQPVTAAA